MWPEEKADPSACAEITARKVLTAVSLGSAPLPRSLQRASCPTTRMQPLLVLYFDSKTPKANLAVKSAPYSELVASKQAGARLRA